MTLNILGDLNVSSGNFMLTNAVTPNTPNITINVSGSINISGGITHFQTPPVGFGGVTTFTISATNFNVTAGTLILFAATAGLGSTSTINISNNFTQSGGTVNNCSIGGANGIILDLGIFWVILHKQLAHIQELVLELTLKFI